MDKYLYSFANLSLLTRLDKNYNLNIDFFSHHIFYPAD